MCSRFYSKPHPAYLLLLFTLLPWGSSVFAQLNANFTVDKNNGCAPLTVAFTNTSTGASANAVYTWDLGNGNTATVANPGAIYTNEQVYTVTLTVKDGGQTSVKTQQVTVHKTPEADFTASISKGCLPLAVTFTSQSTPGSGAISSYYWDFGDGSTQQGYNSNQAHTYQFEQTASVSLTVTNNFGCHNTIRKDDIVKIIPALNARFTADKRVLCKETDAVQFTNTSNGPGTLSYTWDFGDGITTTDKNPNHVFNKKGIYTVKLTVTSSEGCTSTSTQTNLLNVASYSTDFEVPALICKGSPVVFNGKSSPQPDVSIWTVDGFPMSYYSNTLQYTFSTPGVHTVALSNTFGTCPEAVSKQVTIKDIPAVNGFIAETEDSCGAPAKVSFRDTTAAAVKWAWDFNYLYWPPKVNATQQAPTYTYPSDNNYHVMLTVTNADGCSNTTSKYFQTIRPFVTIDATSMLPGQTRSSCDSLVYKFAATSSDPIVSYEWLFGDGGRSTAPEPVYTYKKPGTFQVTLNYTTRAGCSGSTYYNNFTIYRKPEVDFSTPNTNICGNTPVVFSATVTPAQDVGALYYQWNFSDGIYPGFNTAVIQHTFEQAGEYSVQVIASNGYCSDTAIKTNYVKVVPPFPRISNITNTCDGTRGDVMIFSASREATSLIWEFGDGTPAVTTAGDQSSLSHTYTKTGSYMVSITAVNGQCSVKKSAQATVLLKQKPTLTGDKVEVCAEDAINIRVANYEKNPRLNDGSNHFGVMAEYDDGTAFNGSMMYNGPTWWTNVFDGKLTGFNREKTGIRIITTSGLFNCKDTTNVIPIKIKGAAAGFGIINNNVCFKDPIVLKDTSKSYNGTIQQWRWDFGDGQSSTQSGTVSHTYTNPGAYYVNLQVTDASGCISGTAAYSHMVQINGPKANFTASGYDVPLNSMVYFNNGTNNYGSYNTTYSWLIDGVEFSTAMYPSYTFTQPGTYTIKLVATDPLTGCSSDMTRAITVKNFNAGFNFNKTNITANNCPPVLVRFNNTSSNFTGIKWDFGDGYTLENVNYPSHIYEKPGKYYITLYVYGPNGLRDQYIDSLDIPQPAAQVTASALEGCIGHTVTLNAQVNNAGSYIWDFGDGSILQTSDSFATHTYTTPGSYIPALLIKDATGCSGAGSLPNTIQIRSNPVVNITPVDPVLCLGASLPLQASGGLHYSWSPATGLSDAGIAAPLASPVNNTTYTVQVTDDLGCKNSGSVTIKVVQPVSVQIQGNTNVCAGNEIPLQGSGADLYTWINNTTGLSHTTIANPVASPQTNSTYTVVGADAHHCFTDTASIDIEVYPLPTVDAGPDIEVWAGNPAQLQATGSADVISYNWTLVQYLSCTTCPNPISTTPAQTWYTVAVKNNKGCTASDSVLVKLTCDESRVRIPNGITPNNDGHNDVFMIKGVSLVHHLVIFNRYGQRVYERRNIVAGDRSQCWDGTLNGQPAAQGTYVYLAELECPVGGRFMRKGTLTVIR